MKVLRNSWKVLSRLPYVGKWLFSRILGLAVPYSGSLAMDVEELSPGYCRVALRDTWRARNHLKSIHAIALANLAELPTGLALNYALPADQRSILVGLEMSYQKKARGRLTAECRVETAVTEGDVRLTSTLRNAADEVVAVGVATWKVSTL
jgi:acyl-coenzyme A thioesterase PaaI-like protein